MRTPQEIISNISKQLYAGAFLKAVVLSMAVGLLVLPFSALWSVVFGLLVFLVAGYLFGLFSSKKTESIRFIHHNISGAEHSLELLEVEKPNIAEQLQLERLSHHLANQSLPNIAFKGLMPYVLALGVAFAISMFLPKLRFNNSQNSASSVIEKEVVPEAEKSIPPKLKNAKVKINPPAYTGLSASSSTDLNISAMVGTVLSWELTFSHQDQLKVFLNNCRGEKLAFQKSNAIFTYSDKLLNSGLYGIQAFWKDSLVYQSDFYHLEAIADLAPKIEPTSKDLYKFHFLKDPKTLQVAAKVSDDFLVKQVYLVATLARGSGENVKFREVKFPIASANFKTSNVSKTIDLKALNFTPGDELYYYWAAIDNKSPEPNFSKSDTYFLIYKDTAAAGDGELATMAMNILPEYFRSQRQIIIDTEKLISKRGKIKREDFNAASNEIGFDQKALRIRYGQYLGEEYESSIGGHGHGDSENLLEGFMHKHDSEEEGHHDHSHDHEHEHSHSTAPKEGENQLADILAEYVHSHDDAESNTFYEQSTRSLLKAALEQMWQSELHLRLYEPEKALPYEHKALEFLKEAQHKARTFIAKTSYDPPPIKEKENRMKGELKKFNAKLKTEVNLTQVQVQKLAAEVIGFIGQSLSANQKQKVMLLSNQLSNKAVNSGMANWSLLTYLRKMVNDQRLGETEVQKLKTGLFELTGSQKSGFVPNVSVNKQLEKEFRKNLQ